MEDDEQNPLLSAQQIKDLVCGLLDKHSVDAIPNVRELLADEIASAWLADRKRLEDATRVLDQLSADDDKTASVRMFLQGLVRRPVR